MRRKPGPKLSSPQAIVLLRSKTATLLAGISLIMLGMLCLLNLHLAAKSDKRKLISDYERSSSNSIILLKSRKTKTVVESEILLQKDDQLNFSPAEVHVSLRSQAQRLLEEQVEALSLLSPDLLQLIAETASGNYFDHKRAQDHQANILLESVLTSGNNVGSGSVSDGQREFYRSLALQHGLRFGNRSNEELFVAEFLRGKNCRRFATVDGPDFSEQVQPNRPNIKDIARRFTIILAESGRPLSDNLTVLDRNRKQLKNYATAHGYAIVDEFSWRRLTATEHIALLFNSLMNSTSENDVIVSLSPLIFVNSLNLSLGSLFRLSSQWRQYNRVFPGSEDSLQGPEVNDPQRSAQLTADFLPIDVIASVNSVTDPRAFLRTDFVMLRNNQRTRDLLVFTHRILKELQKYGSKISVKRKDHDDSSFADALTLAYYKSTDMCLQTLLIPPNTIIKQGSI